MKTIALRNLGRFGNQMFRYAYARALAEQNGWELRTEPWVGERIFTLDGGPHERPTGNEDVVIDEYRQAQKDLIYSRTDCRRWFKLQSIIQATLDRVERYEPHHVYAHLRHGDYASAGYPMVSVKAVLNAMDLHGIPHPVIFVSDNYPTPCPELPDEIEFLHDFYRLMRAPALFRANSSFSWWAATLGHGKVFAPIITGFAGGVEHDNIPYVEGNWPRLAELDFVTDLHLRET